MHGSAALLAFASLAAADASRREAGVQVFLLRHAEKDSNDARDPDLSTAGRARAAELARVLGNTRVTHLFASEYKRTQQTLQPLAERASIEIAVVPGGEAMAQVEALRRLPAGAVAVVAGHSNTIPALVQQLGGTVEHLEQTPRGPMLPDAAFDRLFLVVLPPPGGVPAPAPLACVELRYGAATPPAGEERPR